MDIQLLKKTGNIDQICGIRESVLLSGPSKGTRIARLYKAAGLDLTVVTDRCMDLYDFSYKGINLAFHSKNGLQSPFLFSPQKDEFPEQWPGGLLCTCGLRNINLHNERGAEVFPTHGRIGSVPAMRVQPETEWIGDRYFLRLKGEMHETRMLKSHLSLKRTIETEMFGHSIRITDCISNENSSPEPVMLLYHFNFGYPLIEKGATAVTEGISLKPLNPRSSDPVIMTDPERENQVQSFLGTCKEKKAAASIMNERLKMGVRLEYETEFLPHLVEWKHLLPGDCVLSFEPTNAAAVNRETAEKEGKLTVLQPFETMQIHLTLTVLDGSEEIRKEG